MHYLPMPTQSSWDEKMTLEDYVQLFGNLRTDRQGDRPRPHKAVMLLSVITLAESRQLGDGCIRFSPDLLEIFARIFDIVRAGNDQRTPFNPFFYLRSDGFWHRGFYGFIGMRPLMHA